MSRSLFADDSPPPLAARLRPVLRELAERGVYFGTSSWKYPGWLGSIYTEDRYRTRGKFSKKKFDELCLQEYAETFPVVGGDFSFYRFPTADQWDRIFGGTPRTLQYCLKVPEDVTVVRWPTHARYGNRAGESNPHFLDTGLFERALLGPLAPHADQVAVLMFEFGTFAKKDFAEPGDFLERLERFLGSLPAGWRYAVEIRNPEYLGTDYFGVLSRHGVAHVFNAWTRMPVLPDQVALPGSFTADFAVVRALLAKGTTYEQAVEAYTPYESVQSPHRPTREALAAIARWAVKERKRAYSLVNNRLEGNAPGTIAAVAEELGQRGG